MGGQGCPILRVRGTGKAHGYARQETHRFRKTGIKRRRVQDRSGRALRLQGREAGQPSATAPTTAPTRPFNAGPARFLAFGPAW